MGADLFGKYPDVVKETSDILGYSIVDLCMCEPEKLNNTLYTQPAVYFINALCYYDNVQALAPDDVLAGHSLGEYSALMAAGAFTYGDGLRIVKRRAEIMSKAADGKMMAVTRINENSMRSFLEKHASFEVELSNINSHTQIVLSGKENDLLNIENALNEHGYMCKLLNVSGPFHSRFYEESSRDFNDFLSSVAFNELKNTVISNVTGMPYPKDIAATLSNHLTRGVRWVDCVEYMLDGGCDIIEQIGVGKSLISLVAQIKRSWNKGA